MYLSFNKCCLTFSELKKLSKDNKGKLNSSFVECQYLICFASSSSKKNGLMKFDELKSLNFL